MQLFEAICRAPGCATPANGCATLRRLANDRPEFLRHVISSHEHIVLSSRSCIAAVYDRRSEALALIERRYSCLGLAQLRSDGTLFADCIFLRRGGRAVDRAGLENRKAERPREFESHPLRTLTSYFLLLLVLILFDPNVISAHRLVIGGCWLRARKNTKLARHIESPALLRTQHRISNARRGTFGRARSGLGSANRRGRRAGVRKSKHQKTRSRPRRGRRETRGISY